MDTLWTLPELVTEVAARIAALPPPKNGQVRAVPDDRTVRYYVTLGLLDRPSAMRGRTALYGRKHVAQVVAIKRLQSMGRSLSEIQQLWPTLDDVTLARMSGVALPVGKPARAEFWKREPRPIDDGDEVAEAADATPGGLPVEPEEPPAPVALPPARVVKIDPRGWLPRASGASGVPAAPGPAVEVRIELAPQVVLSLSVTDESVVISPADIRAVRAAAAPLLAELASRRLATHAPGEES